MKKPPAQKTVETTAGYGNLLEEISGAFAAGQRHAYQAVNTAITQTYWEIGRHIVEFEQKGNVRAEYGQKLLDRLSRDLTLRHGKGFSRSNLVRIRQFYLVYPIGAKPSHQLSWSHIVELLKLDDPLERGFYEKQTLIEKWSVPELKRQKDSSLFLRLAAGKDKKNVLELARNSALAAEPSDILRSPYVFEFLNIPETPFPLERELEDRLCRNLSSFLLELGKGFTFVKRQFRLTLNNRHYHVDLVFYHRILRCFVLIDLKTKDLQHEDIGQMNMYLGYFAKEENIEGDNPPVGIILTRQKDKLLVEYATYGMDSRLFVQKYQLYLPNREELRREIEHTLAEAEAEDLVPSNKKKAQQNQPQTLRATSAQPTKQ
jgi:predicted nuclease of restriction endonuclease-like (RecB) superfamily